MRDSYQINEIFDSIQGEGYWTGRPATFIRLQGCTVGCPWCDSGPIADETLGRRTNGMTRNTWSKGGIRMTVEDIISQVHNQHVIITGGEPTLYDLDALLDPLQDMSCFTQLETSGQNELKGHLTFDWITWSPKDRLNWCAPESIKWAADEVKWVVDDELQLIIVKKLWRSYVQRTYNAPWFFLMPEGCPPRPEMISKTLEWLTNEHMPNDPDAHTKWRFGDRLQYRLGVR